MAFFGLTALGPQNTFAALRKDYSLILVFEEEDIVNAFSKAADGEVLDVSQLNQFLRVLFRGAPPEGELARLEKYLTAFRNGSSDDAISKDELMTVISRIQADLSAEQSKITKAPNSDFRSNSEFHEARRRHIRGKRGPTDAYSAPLTMNHNLGWKAATMDVHEKREIKGKKSCPETMYQSELIKSGIFY